MLSFVNIINTSALNYQTETDIKFTFNPTLSINISSSNLTIDNLTPGTTSDSNTINVSVATNASHGYTLSATVGDSLHNNTNLTHTNGTNTFDSIATNSSLPNLTTDNTWGYSYKLSNNTNWNNYSGLSSETSKTLVNTDSQLTKPIDFKIAAKASSTQPSGTYTNTINFIAISKPIPKTIEDIVYMQTFGELVDTDLQSIKDSMILNQDYTLKDSRDEKEYYITKLEDGHIWMTQNLDLDLSHDRPLTSDDTDLNDATSAAYQDGYTVNGSVIYWTPSNTANTTNFEGGTGSSVAMWQMSPQEPYSANKTDGPSTGHESLGNYYNWTAVIASNDSDGFAANTLNDISQNPQNSICPKGWRLPTISSQSETEDNSTNEFARLNLLYNDGETSGENSEINLTTAPLWFKKAGWIITDGTFYNYNTYALYWSSTVRTSGIAYSLYFIRGRVTPVHYDYNRRSYGQSVRCLAR